VIINEDNLSDDAKAVLLIIRDEANAGKLTERQQEFLNKAIMLQQLHKERGTRWQ